MKKLILLGTIIVSLALKAGYLEEGKLYYANKNYLKAEEMFLKAVQEGNVEGMNYLGNLYYKQKKIWQSWTNLFKCRWKGKW